MRDDICTIPVSEVFEHNDGCPICRMRDTIEERMTDYILGDAMMELPVDDRGCIMDTDTKEQLREAENYMRY